VGRGGGAIGGSGGRTGPTESGGAGGGVTAGGVGGGAESSDLTSMRGGGGMDGFDARPDGPELQAESNNGASRIHAASLALLFIGRLSLRAKAPSKLWRHGLRLIGRGAR